MEAILLTGGASRRMGEDKAKLLVQGEALAGRIARLLRERGLPVTVCGREPLEGFAFHPDREEYAGPLVALAGFTPKEEFVFVSSCDLPGFDPRIVDLLSERIGAREACIPSRDGRLQPLCALYRASTFASARSLVEAGERRVLHWIHGLDVQIVEDADPSWIANVNTREDLRVSLEESPPADPPPGS
ncbi:MAG TPA: molybdenum cofactor guanylyltransferase [Fimbriimonadaceae bacterium]|nr:molybdenum cofactor guanylyltransferase [Fimbriimonadaceae bacterium]